MKPLKLFELSDGTFPHNGLILTSTWAWTHFTLKLQIEKVQSYLCASAPWGSLLFFKVFPGKQTDVMDQ